jgi:SagB-type dehydrogenase family enzyme
MTMTGKEYHDKTSYERRSMKGHTLDWANRPSVYKAYDGLEMLELPVVSSWPDGKTSDILSAVSTGAAPALPTLEDLGKALSLAYGLTARSRHPGGEFYLRSAPSAGALYPCEIYVASRSASGLEDGLYHYSMARGALVKLRSGAFPHFAALRGRPEGVEPCILFYVTAIFFRSAWKYRDRSYRYDLLDAGHVVEGLYMALRALRLPVLTTYDFDDEKVNRLLGLDAKREACLAVAAVLEAQGGSSRAHGDDAPGAMGELPESCRSASRVSPREAIYPLVEAIHTAAFKVIEPVAGDSAEVGAGPLVERLPTSWMEIGSGDGDAEEMGFVEAVLHRRSRRNFKPGDLRGAVWKKLVAMLCEPCGGAAEDGVCADDHVGVGFLAAGLEGLEDGFYLLDRAKRCVGVATPGSGRTLTAAMAHVCLDQEWLRGAAMHFVLLANLDAIDATLGPRGYRCAMIAAGRLGHRVYVGATALGLGCCGIGAYYDGEAARLLGLQDASRMLYLLGVGPVKRA